MSDIQPTRSNIQSAEVPTTDTYLDRLYVKSPPPSPGVRIEGSMKRRDEYKYLSVYFDQDQYPDRIEILMLTDVQFGHLSCDVDRFIEYRDWVLSVPHRFVLFGGDMVDAATAVSIASPYDNTEEPQGQVYRFVELALPLRSRIIGYVGGNHERRGIKTFGDLGHLIALLLRIPYSAGKQFIDIYYGKHLPFKSSLWHGRGASITKGAKAQMLHRFMGQGESQMYWVGHLHDSILLWDWREKRVQGEIRLEKYCGVMSSSFLEYWGTYAEVAGLAPSDTMMARVILEPDGRWEVTLR